MNYRLGRTLFDIYAMDIETHNDPESIMKRETSMWLGSFINEESKVEDEDSYFYTMGEFIDRLESLSSRKRKKIKNKLQKRPCINIAVYIYNLSFEWSFILPELLSRGFEFKESISKEDEHVFNSITTKSVSSVWQVEIKFKKNSGKVILRDLAKIFGGGLGEVAKVFKLNTQKGEIDYRLNRLHDHVITKEEKEYCFKDTRIIVDVLLKEIELNDKDFFKSVSMASYSMLKLLKTGYPRKMKPYSEFRKEYPFLGEEENKFVRNALAGGICYATRKYQFIDIKDKVLHIDAHQMYPSQVYLHRHPCGEGTYFTGEPTKFAGYINCCHIKVSFDDVRIHSVIKLIGIDFAESMELYVWDFEIPTMRKCYVNLEVEYIDGYCYKSKILPWRNYVKTNYDKRLVAKANKDAYNTLRYKLLNNAGAYGKFVERPHLTVNKNYINEDGIIDSIIEDKHFDPESEYKMFNAKYTYIPLSTIPAYGRVCLIETALKFGVENIIYFDTDSIFCIYNEFTKKVLKTLNLNDELGGWGIEEILSRAQFTSPKRYKTIDEDGKTTIKAGGINFDEYKERAHNEEYEDLINQGYTRKEALEKINLPYEEINIVSSIWKVQRAYRVKGGTIIEFQDREMKVQDKYIDIYKKNLIK